MTGGSQWGDLEPPVSLRQSPCLPVLCLVGPTATGKSDLGIEVAKAVGGEVLSADSMQVYKGMDIGTAKLSLAERDGVPHHLIDLVEPNEPFTVANWTKAADQVIAAVHQSGRLPIVVGGTGLYVRAIVEDLDFAEHAGTSEVRAKWQAFLDAHGANRLHDELKSRDAVQANRIHPNDVRRVIRALEVFESGGRAMSVQYDWRLKGGRYDTVQFGLMVDRPSLYQKINERVRAMVQAGLLEEVSGLLARGFDERLTAMQAIGYKEMLRAVRGEVTVDDAGVEIARATRRFAKRQLSWFGRDTRIQWLSVAAGLPDRYKDNILRTATALAAGIRDRQRE